MDSERFSLPPIDIEEAQQMLAGVDAMQAAAREELNAHGWQWYLVWAVVCLGAAVSALTPAAGSYWRAAVPLGIAATVAVSIRQEGRSGVQRHPGPYWLVGGSITMINFGAGAWLADEVVVVVVWVVFGVGFAAFARLERQPFAATLFMGLATATALAGLLVPDTFVLYMVVGFVYALTMTGVAAGIRSAGTPR